MVLRRMFFSLIASMALVACSISEGDIQERLKSLDQDENISFQLKKQNNLFDLTISGEFENISNYETFKQAIAEDTILNNDMIRIIDKTKMLEVNFQEILSIVEMNSWVTKDVSTDGNKIVINGVLFGAKTPSSLRSKIDAICYDRKCPKIKYQIKNERQLLLEEQEARLKAQREIQKKKMEGSKLYSRYVQYGYDPFGNKPPAQDKNAMKKYPGKPYNGTPCKEGDLVQTNSFSPYSSIYLREAPSYSSPKLINFRASEILKKTVYKTIDPDMSAYIDCKRDSWYRVWVHEPSWLRLSHVGWVQVDLN